MSKNSETHAVCNKHNIGGKSVCCECSGKTDCLNEMPPKTNEEKWEVIKKAQANFDNRFPPIAIGYDGSESDYKRREAMRDFMSTEVQVAYERADKQKEEAVAEARTKLLFLAKDVLTGMNNEYSIDIKYADKKQWLEPDEFERIFLHRFNNAGIEALTPPTN